jgi:sulfoquinovose isomerase
MTDLTSRAGRQHELRRLLRFGLAAAREEDGAFAYLDHRGRPDPGAGLQLWITARMTHVYALDCLQGHDGAREQATAGVSAIRALFRDDEHGGWFARLAGDGQVTAEGKAMYEHAFVLLAAATATLARVPGSTELLAEAAAVIERHFWDDEAGACRESWDRVWTHTEGYRGANSNMHAVEAFLAAADATGDSWWVHRALRIAERIVHHDAAARAWRLPEHYTADWVVDPDYNQDLPHDRFRPFGVTVGHMLEWSRLLLHLETALDDPPGWLVDEAGCLFDRAMDIGWEADGHPGLVYTVDWADKPVVVERMHWVAVEAVMAANVLARRTDRAGYHAWEERLWTEAARFVDPGGSAWFHELGRDGAPSHVVWSGRPDIYHVAQALLLPDLPLAPSFGAAVRRHAA